MLYRWVLLLSMLPGTISVAQTTDASKSAKVQRLFQVMKLQEMENQMMKQAMDYANSGVTQQILGVKLSPDQQRAVNKLSAKMDDIITNALSWNSLEPDYEKIYAAAYTEQQLDDMLTFYNSPTGQAVVEKTPLLLKQANAIAQQRMALAIPEIQKLLKDCAAQVAATAQHSQSKP